MGKKRTLACAGKSSCLSPIPVRARIRPSLVLQCAQKLVKINQYRPAESQIYAAISTSVSSVASIQFLVNYVYLCWHRASAVF